MGLNQTIDREPEDLLLCLQTPYGYNRIHFFGLRRNLNLTETRSIKMLIQTSAECARPKRAVLVGGHLARLAIPQKVVSWGGDVVRTLPPYLFCRRQSAFR